MRGRCGACNRSADAIADARQAVDLARGTEDPALLLRASDTLLELEGDDALAAEAKATIARILEGLPEGVTRQRFNDSEVVRRIGKYQPGPSRSNVSSGPAAITRVSKGVFLDPNSLRGRTVASQLTSAHQRRRRHEAK